MCAQRGTVGLSLTSTAQPRLCQAVRRSPVLVIRCLDFEPDLFGLDSDQQKLMMNIFSSVQTTRLTQAQWC